MQRILSDHNCYGHARAIFDMLDYKGYLDWLPMKLYRFREVGLSPKADDETVWRFCQENNYILLTGNRSGDDGEQSLELIIHRLVKPTSLLVLTIGNLKRVLARPDYCLRCAETLAEIVFDLENYQGVTRLYIPY